MHEDGFSPYGSGETPILPRDPVDLLRRAEEALDRVDEILAQVNGGKNFDFAGDHFVVMEPIIARSQCL